MASRRTSVWFTVAVLAACSPPTDSSRRVVRNWAPVLDELRGDTQSLEPLTEGELVRVDGAPERLSWKGMVGTREETRDGEVVPVRVDGRKARWVFASDLGEAVSAPTVEWLCRRLDAPPECMERLRRIALADGTLALDPCGSGPCAIAFVRGRSLERTTIPNLVGARGAVIQGKPIALAVTRWKNEERWTGSLGIALSLHDRFKRLATFPMEESDGRSSPTIRRVGLLSVESDVISFLGRRRAISGSDALLYSEAIDERYRLDVFAR